MAEYSSEDEERRPGGRSSEDTLTPDTDFDFELAGYGGQQPQGFFSRPAQSEAAARKTDRQRHSKPEARAGSQAKVGSSGPGRTLLTRTLLSRGRSRRWALLASNSLQKGRSCAASAVTARCGTSTTAATAASPAKLSSGETQPQPAAKRLVNQLYLQDMSILLSINPGQSWVRRLYYVLFLGGLSIGKIKTTEPSNASLKTNVKLQ